MRADRESDCARADAAYNDKAPAAVARGMMRIPFFRREKALCWWCLRPASREGLRRHEVASCCALPECREKERGYRAQLDKVEESRRGVEVIESEIFN